MKKLLFLVTVTAVIALTSSCAVSMTGLRSDAVNSKILSMTVASLEVEPNPVSYLYIPSDVEAKSLSLNQLITNANYYALKEHGKGDVIIQSSYKVDGKKHLFGIKVKTITVTGYPAKYVDFRTPTETDRLNADTFYNGGTVQVLDNYTAKISKFFSGKNH